MIVWKSTKSVRFVGDTMAVVRPVPLCEALKNKKMDGKPLHIVKKYAIFGS
jgi:hypothetical protein